MLVFLLPWKHAGKETCHNISNLWIAWGGAFQMTWFQHWHVSRGLRGARNDPYWTVNIDKRSFKWWSLMACRNIANILKNHVDVGPVSRIPLDYIYIYIFSNGFVKSLSSEVFMSLFRGSQRGFTKRVHKEGSQRGFTKYHLVWILLTLNVH